MEKSFLKYQACICFLQGPVSEAVTEKTSRKTDTSQTRAAAAVSVRKQTNEEKTNTSNMNSNPSIQTNFLKTLSKHHRIWFSPGPMSEAVNEKIFRKTVGSTETSQNRTAAAASVKKQTKQWKANTSNSSTKTKVNEVLETASSKNCCWNLS